MAVYIYFCDRIEETSALDPNEIATLLCKEGLYREACDLLVANGLEVLQPIKLLARSYSCQISRPDGPDLQNKLEGLKHKLKNYTYVRLMSLRWK